MHHKYMRLEGFDTMQIAKFQKLEDFKKIEKNISKWL